MYSIYIRDQDMPVFVGLLVQMSTSVNTHTFSQITRKKHGIYNRGIVIDWHLNLFQVYVTMQDCYWQHEYTIFNLAIKLPDQGVEWKTSASYKIVYTSLLS